MGKANFFWDSKDRRWKCKGASGETIVEFDDTSAKLLKGVDIGEGTEITKVGVLSGTIGGLTAVGTNTVAVATVTGMTGLVVGDKIFVTPKASFAGGIGLVGAFIPTTNTLNVYIANPNIASAGSLPAKGVDVFFIRT